jgi:two-component system, NarL family, nitrate/nitrite response regulator NarL
MTVTVPGSRLLTVDDTAPVLLAIGTESAAGPGLALALCAAAAGRPVEHLTTADAVVAACGSGVCAVMVLDADLPGPGPLVLLERVLALDRTARVLVVFHEDAPRLLVSRAVELGAAGCVVHDAGTSAITAGVLAVLTGGGLVLSRELWPARTDQVGGALVEVGFSRRETDALRLCSRGRRTWQIAADPGVSEDTVETLMKRASRKLGRSCARTRSHRRCGWDCCRSGALGPKVASSCPRFWGRTSGRKCERVPSARAPGSACGVSTRGFW